MERKSSLSTRIARMGINFDRQFGSISVPIYQTAIYRYKKFGENFGYDYSRSENPTRFALESAIADLEGGARGLAFSSGMAAITSLFLLFKPGDEIIATDDLYGGTYRLFQEIMKKYGLIFHYVDFEDRGVVREILEKGRVAALFVETPTNPLMKITDVKAAADLGKEFGAITIVDSTFPTPLLMRPLELGADLVLHSATKYLGGHNDLIGGLIVTGSEELGERVYFTQKAAGAILGPFDSWLLLRGMKTLHVRFERAQENAIKASDFLYRCPQVKRVYFPGIPGHRGNEIHFAQSTGPGAILSFELEEGVSVSTFFESLKVITLAESLGGVESLTTHPSTMTHVDIPETERLKLGITDQLVRVSLGIEDSRDLVDDLDQAIRNATSGRVQ